MTIDVFPDVEVSLLSILGPAFPDIRVSTSLPGDITGTVARVHRVAGANRDIKVDRPIVDVDVFGTNHGHVSMYARQLQAALLSLAGAVAINGVIQRVSTIQGPRQLPEANQALTRYSATYEVFLRADP
jgi:hypothetical protein